MRRCHQQRIDIDNRIAEASDITAIEEIEFETAGTERKLQLLRTGKATLHDTWKLYEGWIESVGDVEPQTLDEMQTRLDELKGLAMVIASITSLAKVFNNLIEHVENKIRADVMAGMWSGGCVPRTVFCSAGHCSDHWRLFSFGWCSPWWHE